jgi:hypothetical protein
MTRFIRLFFCLQRHFLLVLYLLLLDLLEEVKPITARGYKLIGFQLRMNALCTIKQICIERILCGNQAQDRQLPFCHCIPLKRF